MACRKCEELSTAVLLAFEALKTVVITLNELEIAAPERLDQLEIARREYRKTFETFELHLREHGDHG